MQREEAPFKLLLLQSHISVWTTRIDQYKWLKFAILIGPQKLEADKL